MNIANIGFQGMSNDLSNFEINPLNVKQCFKVSQAIDQALQNEARQYLNACEKNPRFSLLLLEMFHDQNEVDPFILSNHNTIAYLNFHSIRTLLFDNSPLSV